MATWKKIVVESSSGTISQNTTGSAATLTTARTIAGVSFNGSADISLNNNAITNGAGYTTNTGTVSSLGDLSVTATASELNILDGATVTTAELNYVTGVTSGIQNQLDGKSASSHTHSNYAPLASPTFTGTVTIPNLIVSGSTTTVNTEEIKLADNRILLNSNASDYTSLSANNGSSTSAGLEIERGSAENAYLTFRELGSASATAHKGQWYMYRPYEATSAQANSNDIERLAAVQSLQYKAGAPTSSDEGHIEGGLLYDTTNNNIYLCLDPYVNNSGGGAA